MRDSLQDLDAQIRRRLAVADDRRNKQREGLEQLMKRTTERRCRFDEVATRVMKEIVRPRVARVIEYFDNASTLAGDDQASHQCVCNLNRSDRFPTSAKLEITAGYDEMLEYLIVGYQLRIIPIYFRFTGHDEIAPPLDVVDDRTLIDWLDARLMGFVEDYLKLETLEQYHRDNTARDPVCGMQIRKGDSAETFEYQGNMYYFCVEGCRNKFTAAPEQYVVGKT